MKKTIGFLSSMMLLTGCYYDVEKELYPPDNCDSSNTTYTSFIKPLMQSQCIACHSSSAPSAGIILDTYTGVKAAAVSGKLYGSIAHNNGFAAMPPTGTQLSSCDLKKVNQWILSGTLNN
jgi:cytochrome c5